MILDNVPKTYNDLKAWLKAHPKRKVIQGDVTVDVWSDEIRFYLYSTPIVSYRPHSVIFSTGGWQTRTTRHWIDSLKPAGIHFAYHEHLKDTWMMSDGKYVAPCDGTVWWTDKDWQTWEPKNKELDGMRRIAKQSIQAIEMTQNIFFPEQSMYGVPNVKRPATIRKYLIEWLDWVGWETA